MNEEVTTASKVIYLAVRMEIYNPDKKEITDDDIKDIISNVETTGDLVLKLKFVAL